MINTCSFGLLVIDGNKYRSDLIIFPNGRVKDPWYRKSGHGLSIDDISDLIESKPEVIIAGTGVSGMVRPEKELEDLLEEKGIAFIPAPNREAIEIYNQISSKKQVGACFHLTC